MPLPPHMVDAHERVDIYQTVDGRRSLEASVLRRRDAVPELRIPQTGHSLTDDGGNFSVHVSADVLEEIGRAARDTRPLTVPDDGEQVVVRTAASNVEEDVERIVVAGEWPRHSVLLLPPEVASPNAPGSESISDWLDRVAAAARQGRVRFVLGSR